MLIPKTVSNAHILSTIPTPRAGFDRLLFSAPLVFVSSSSLPLLSPPESLGLFYQLKGRLGSQALPASSSPTYGLRAAYATIDERIFMDILHRPRCAPCPLFQVQFRACMRHLLDPRVVDHTIKRLFDSGFNGLFDPGRWRDRHTVPEVISRSHRGPWLKLSEVELAIDFPGGREVFRDLQRSFHTPWSGKCYGFDLDDDSRRKGSRRSRNRFRLYEKFEAGMEVNRAEWVIGRQQLRGWRVDTVADLLRVPWTDRVPRRMRLVDFHSSRRDSGRVQYMYGGQVKVRGVNGALQKHSRKNSQWLRGRLHPNDYQGQAEEALRAFEEGLQKDLRLRR